MGQIIIEDRRSGTDRRQKSASVFSVPPVSQPTLPDATSEANANVESNSSEETVDQETVDAENVKESVTPAPGTVPDGMTQPPLTAGQLAKSAPLGSMPDDLPAPTQEQIEALDRVSEESRPLLEGNFT